MATFTLVLKDEDVATWAAVNNCFPHKKNNAVPAARYWNGVFVYLGSKRDIVSTDLKQALHETEAVVIEFDNGDRKAFSRQEMMETGRWINIIAANPNGAEPPMTVEDYHKLYPPVPSAEYFDPCPGGLITFWQPQAPGSNYTITAIKTDKHDRYELSCDKGTGFIVEVHQYDANMLRLDKVVKISVNASGNGGGPSDTINPVQRP